MLVEDDPTMLSLLRMLLEIEDYEVVEWDSSAESNKSEDLALAVQRERPDLLILDVHLQDSSGIDLLRLIREDPYLKDVRVLMTSGMDLASKCRREGADGFIQKPYMPDELINVIQTTLGD
jgi:CheY-like chemotaxis protein